MTRTRGFTVLEVMLSLGVMTIGAMAMLAMQQQVTRANVHARQLTQATQIAQTWIERLKVDANAWNSVANPPADLAGTRYLLNITVANMAGAFTTIPQVPFQTAIDQRWVSSGFDYYSDDVDLGTNMGAVRFCASYRLSWIYANRLIRADVRVFWPKDEVDSSVQGTTNSLAQEFPLCADDNSALNPGGAQYDHYHVVYLSTAIRPLM